MSEPLDMLDPELAALLEVEKGRPEPPAEAAARVLGRLARTLPIGPGPGPDAPPSPPGSAPPGAAPPASAPPSSAPPPAPVPGAAGPASPGSAATGNALPAPAHAPPPAIPVAPASGLLGSLRGAAKGWIIFLLGGTSGAVGHAVVSRVATPAPAAVSPKASATRENARENGRSSSVVGVVQDASTAAGGPAPVAAPPLPVPAGAEAGAPRSPVPPRSGSTRSTGGSAASGAAPSSSKPLLATDVQMHAERKLIEMARTTLVRGQTEEALAHLQRHAQLFPSGELQEEREGLFIQALVRHGDGEQARVRAARFRARFPRSLFMPVIDDAIREIP